MAISFETFEEAEALKTEHDMVCGVRVSETEDRYFVVDADTPDDQIHELSFEIKNGRARSSYEKWVADMAGVSTDAHTPEPEPVTV